MLSQIVGQVDSNAALVLVVFFAAVCIVSTALIVKRRSRLDINNEHELAVIKNSAEMSRAQYVAETNRMVEFKKIDQNLITSHREE